MRVIERYSHIRKSIICLAVGVLAGRTGAQTFMQNDPGAYRCSQYSELEYSVYGVLVVAAFDEALRATLLVLVVCSLVFIKSNNAAS
jgi:hypothetical protein